ncbi:E3 ubiquitin-protein ligase PRT1 isoform X2 [Malania oleifera]|uniref:E3 ubiquitin-protein ligase PRT1 isoform X2 n=1 Tax=Malania oleifera TaxID=397392 RepID=UPI0025AE0A49|nr:E3 ubiquitin-protein ligase PRT1 isoform X2 [Malania oleifera]
MLHLFVSALSSRLNLSCGHMSCFWCVHESMSGFRESHCPICRHPYYHFPSICQMLHFLLLKMYPDAYERRKNQILEKENKVGSFSPQFDAFLFGSHTDEGLNPVGNLMHSSMTSSPSNLFSDPCFTRKEESSTNMDQSESILLFQDSSTTIPKPSSTEDFEVPETISMDKNSTESISESAKCMSTADILCAACKELLFQPVVLNCGHAYCKTCVEMPMDGTLRCQVCQCLDPRGFPKVCLELDHFLEQQFPEEYAMRKAVQIKHGHLQPRFPTTGSTEAGNQRIFSSSLPAGEILPWWSEDGPKVHIGIGCDYCGMYPIIGDRYRCIDCVEKIGFDLCGDCYNTCSKLPGRFNQQHTPEHRFERVNSRSRRNSISSLVLGHIEDDFAASAVSNDASEDQQNGSNIIRNISRLVLRHLEDDSPAYMFSNDASEDPENGSNAVSSDDAMEEAENGLAASITNNDSAEDQNNTQSSI